MSSELTSNTGRHPRSRRLRRRLLVAVIAAGLLILLAARTDRQQSIAPLEPVQWIVREAPAEAQLRAMQSGLLLMTQRSGGALLQFMDWRGAIAESSEEFGRETLIHSTGDTYAVWDQKTRMATVYRWPNDVLYSYRPDGDGLTTVSIAVDAEGSLLLAGISADGPFVTVVDEAGAPIWSYSPGELPIVARFLGEAGRLLLITFAPGEAPAHRVAGIDPPGDVVWRGQLSGVPRSVAVCPQGGYAGVVTSDEVVVVTAEGRAWTGEPPVSDVYDTIVTPDGRIINLYCDEGAAVAREMRHGGASGWEAIVGGAPGSIGLVGGDVMVITSTTVLALTRQGSPLWDIALPLEGRTGSEGVISAGSSDAGVYVLLDNDALMLFTPVNRRRGSDSHQE